MKILFCIYGYGQNVERLQPWLTVYEVAKLLIESGWEVHLISDGDNTSSLNGMRCHYVKTMRPSNRSEVRTILDEVRPDRVVALVSPLSLVFPGWYKDVRCPLIAYLSYPFYTRAELARALPHLCRDDMVAYGRHALVPDWAWAGTLRKYFCAVIAQSNRTARRVSHAAGSGVVAYGLHAGLDLDFWKPGECRPTSERTSMRFIYVGSPKAIRGFIVLLDAFQRLTGNAAELKVLARGSTEAEVDELRQRIKTRVGESHHRIEIIGGWMERERYRDELRSADVVVLPFVLVPSELPVSVIECIACGTPVITTNIDGLPEAIGDAGMVVRSGSVAALAKAMADLVNDPAQLKDLRERCHAVRTSMKEWSSVGEEWRRVLSA